MQNLDINSNGEIEVDEHKEVQELEKNFFIPLNNLYFDEALKKLTSSEFKTYMAITFVIKKIGPNTKNYFSSKIELHEKVRELTKVSYQTFLKHLRTLESIALIEFLNSNAISICYDIADSKSYGFTAIEVDSLEYLIKSLDQNELKLYMTIYRLLKGFNKKQARYSYAQLKAWSGIKNRATFIKSRNSLSEKKLVLTLLDLNRGTYTFKLLDIKVLCCTSELDLKPLTLDLKPLKRGVYTDLKPLIKKSTSLNKSLKESCLKKFTFDKKARFFKKQNEEKIFNFLNENERTKNLAANEKITLIEKLTDEVKTYGGFKNVKVKSTIDFYLAQYHSMYGKNLDKIIDRYFERTQQEKRDNKARHLFYKLLNKYFPEEAHGLSDFQTNELSCFKLDKLIKKSPPINDFCDGRILKSKESKNPLFSLNQENKRNILMQELIYRETGEKDISIDERFSLVEKHLTTVNDRYPYQNEFIITEEKIDFKQFLKLSKNC